MSEHYHPDADISEDVQISISSNEWPDGKKDIYAHVTMADAITMRATGPNIEYALLELIRLMAMRLIELEPVFEPWRSKDSKPDEDDEEQ